MDILDSTFVMPIRDKIRPAAAAVVQRLVDSGYEAFIVGGAVRDLLLDHAPKDYDIATSASPEEVQAVFSRRFCRIIGRRFRLAHVFSGGDIYEVSTFRREPTASERRGRYDDDGVMIWNDNRYGTLEEDARRRDFTVNSLYYDVAGNRGIIDLVGGIDDMRRRVVRTVGDPALRLEEDPVRLLRALKLVGQQGFTLEPELGAALRKHAASIRLASVSRLFEELLKIFFTGRSLEIFTAFADYGLLAHFWPASHWARPRGTRWGNVMRLCAVATIRVRKRWRWRRPVCRGWSASCRSPRTSGAFGGPVATAARPAVPRFWLFTRALSSRAFFLRASATCS